MNDLLNNPWLVGIVGGIISGLIVFFVTKYIFSKRENREYLQRVKTANNEIFYSIRLLIADKLLPKEEFIDSLIFATSAKYNVDCIHLYATEELADDLIKEILDNIFLSSEEKLEYCDILNKMKDMGGEGAITDSGEEVSKERKDNRPLKLSKQSYEFFSGTLAVITTLFTLLFFLNSKSLLVFESYANVFIIIITIASIPLFVIVFLYRFRNLKNKKNLTNDNNPKNE